MGPTSWKLKASAILALAMVGSGPHVPLKDVSGVSIPEDKATVSVDVKALTEKGAYKEAAIYLKNRLSSANIKQVERARILHTLGYLFLLAERTEDATENTQTAYAWALKQGLLAEAAAFRTELSLQQTYVAALDLRSSGNIAASNSKFEAAAQLAGAIKSQPYQLIIADAWSWNFFNSGGDQSRYLALSLQALELADALNFRVEASRAARKVGSYYALKTDYSRALNFFLKALNYLGGERADSDVVRCLNNIAGIYVTLGDYIKARDYLLAATSHTPEQTKGTLGTSMLINLGYLFSNLGKRTQSEEYRQKALDCFSSYLDQERLHGGGPLRLEALAGMAGVYINQGRLEEAREILSPALQEAREKKDSALTTGKILSYLGETSLQTGMMNEAEQYFKETDSISRRTNNPLLAMSAAYGLGRCAEARGDIGQAIDSYSIALKIVGEGFSSIDNDIHRADFIGKSREPFKALIRLYLKLSGTEGNPVYDREIFRLSEYLRARSYLELRDKLTMNQQSLGQPSAGLEEAKLGQERIRLLRMLAQGNLGVDERERLAARIGQIDDMLDAAVFDRYGTEDQSARPSIPVSLRLIQGQILDDRTAILEYLMGETGSMLFCICKDSFHLIELPPSLDLRDSLTGYLSFLEDPSIPAAKGLPAAQRLYQILLAPAEPFLPARVDRLIIVPDGILFRLPFEALVLPGIKAGTPEYVHDRFAVSYAPSASSLDPVRTRQEDKYPKDALAFGVSKYPKPSRLDKGPSLLSPAAVLDDIYERQGFAVESLPHVKGELADLKKRFTPDRIDAYQDQRATETALKALDLKAYRLIHLACHAFSDDSYPLRSALLMSPEVDDREDGYLQVSEMYDLRTNADLVVLSACQTGRGAIVMNEGNLGLPRVFFYMGAKSVLSTLWPVNDDSCALFMKFFYDAYFRGDGKAEALGAAKRAMRGTKFAHPYFWASYTLTGRF